jgi:hypothetical protein
MALALVTLAFGLAATWLALRISRANRGGRDWPTVPGRILERGLGERMDQLRYRPHVKYSYSVGSREYVNNRVYLFGHIGREAGATRRLVDGLPDPVPVHYDPRDPARSYLLASPRWTFWITAAFGIGMILMGLLQLAVVAAGVQE